MATNIDQLADEIKKAMEQYTDEVAQGVEQSVKDAAEYCVQQIRSNAQSSFGGSGAYAASWTVDDKESTKYKTVKVVHAGAPYYRLTHLLEKGHSKWVWGKSTGGSVKGRPHIRPAERDMITKFSEDVTAKIKRAK